MSPYNYVGNNPISRVDIMGLSMHSTLDATTGGMGSGFSYIGDFSGNRIMFDRSAGLNHVPTYTWMDGTVSSGWVPNSDITTYVWKTTVTIVDVPNIFGQDVNGRIPSQISGMNVHSRWVDVSTIKGHFVSDDGREFWSGAEVRDITDDDYDPRNNTLITGYPPGVGFYKVFNIMNTIRGFRNVIRGLVRLFSRGSKNAFNIAKSGGKHSGFLKNYLGRSPEELRKAINSLQNGKRGINTHLDYISNPVSHVENWHTLRVSHQQHLLNHWKTEIKNAKEQIVILKRILGN